MSTKLALFSVVAAITVNCTANTGHTATTLTTANKDLNLAVRGALYTSLLGTALLLIYDKLIKEGKTPEQIEQEIEQKKERPVSDQPIKVNREYIKDWLEEGVPYDALKKAIYYIEHDKEGRITNHEYMTVIDFTAPSTEQRMFLLNLESGEMQKSLAAHGARTGGLKATNFSRSNKINSNKTTPGFHKFSEVYRGQHGLSYRLDGLEDRNSEARDKDVVVHAAKYATTAWIKKYGWLGRSQGCPAVSPDTMKKLLEKQLSGTLLYNYTILDKEENDKKLSGINDKRI